MPYLGVDSWRWQYFDEPCPDDVVVPIDDATAWEIFPAHRWIYDKLAICATQGLPHAPHGVAPTSFPVFSKPIYNMRGMGTGSRVIRSAEEYTAAIAPGHMWMKLCEGEHLSTDVAVLDGAPVWLRHTTGIAAESGMFDYWTVHAEPMPALEAFLGDWVRKHLGGFSGIVNFETIGGTIIECHLRMSEQWLDLNGPGWLAAVVRLYAKREWHFGWRPRTGYSVVLFGAHGVRWRIDHDAVERLRAVPGVASIQITFEEEKPPAHHAMPPGGFRLAIVNCWDLAVGRRVRSSLANLFATDERPRHEAMSAATS
jgi:hypothetical protein